MEKFEYSQQRALDTSIMEDSATDLNKKLIDELTNKILNGAKSNEDRIQLLRDTEERVHAVFKLSKTILNLQPLHGQSSSVLEPVSVDEATTSLMPSRKRRRLSNSTSDSGGKVDKGTSKSVSIKEGDADNIHKIRLAFEKELSGFAVLNPADNEVWMQVFTREEVQKISYFFFDEIMGPQSLARLAGLIKAYKEYKVANCSNAKMTIQSTDTSGDEKLPRSIRDFVKTHRHNIMDKSITDSGLKCLRKITHHRKLRGEYNKVLSFLECGDAKVVKYAQSQGFTQPASKDWASVTIQLLSTLCDSTPPFMNSDCKITEKLDLLVEKFGEGVIPLLPSMSVDVLFKHGPGYAKLICDVFVKHLTSFGSICNLIREHVYQPFVQGAPRMSLRDPRSRQDGTKTFLELLEYATEPLSWYL